MPSRLSAQSEQLEGAIDLADNIFKDDPKRHAWLYKDGPHDDLGQPIVEYWAENQSLCIKLGSSPLPLMKSEPIELLQRMIDECIDPGLPFQLVAELEEGQWPLSQGYRRLGDYLAFIGAHELDFGSWTSLQICLPDTLLPYDAPATPIIPLESLTNLRHLLWCGHRNQLTNSWLPLTPPILQSLYTLDLTCEIALTDCLRILLHGKRLKEFAVNAIEVNTDEVLTLSVKSPSNYRSGEHRRPYLEYLKINSSADITPLLYPFYFSSLRSINLVLSYPTKLRTLPRAFEWKTMESVTLLCDLSDADSQWIRDACNLNTQHHHISFCRFLDHTVD